MGSVAVAQREVSKRHGESASMSAGSVASSKAVTATGDRKEAFQLGIVLASSDGSPSQKGVVTGSSFDARFFSAPSARL
jgi:hypothetical protein